MSVQGAHTVAVNLRAFSAHASQAMQRAFVEEGLLIEGEAKRRAPVDEGRLRSDIHMEIRPGQVSVISGSTVDYAIHVHEGTKPHEIVPKRGKVLRFKAKDGRVVYAPRVRHPGAKPRPYLRDAFDARAPHVAGKILTILNTFRPAP